MSEETGWKCSVCGHFNTRTTVCSACGHPRQERHQAGPRPGPSPDTTETATLRGPPSPSPQSQAFLEHIPAEALPITPGGSKYPPLTPFWRLYYWANIVLNPLLLLLLFALSKQESAAIQVACITAAWAILSGILNPRLRIFVAGGLPAVLESLPGLVGASCYVLLFGGVGAILLISAAIVCTGLLYAAILLVVLAALWIDGLIVIRKHAATA